MHIIQPEALDLHALHHGIHLADGQFAPFQPPHLRSTLFRNVDLERCLTADVAPFRAIHGLPQLEFIRLHVAREILVERVDEECELHVAAIGPHAAADLHALVLHVEPAAVAQRPQRLQLLHHELLDTELIDDAGFHVALGHALVNVEMYVQLVFVLQLVHTAVGPDRQLVVGSLHDDILERQAFTAAAELGGDSERLLEVLQHGGEGVRDVPELGGARDVAG